MRLIPLDQIVRNPNQPRETFPKEHIEQLAASIKARGLIQPITVRPIDGDRFQIVAGECRYRAHQLLKLPSIKAEIVEIDDDETQWQAMVENLLRRDMNPIEEANAFKMLIERGYDPGRIVSELGLKSTALITQRMQLLNLRPDLQALVTSGQLSSTMAWGVSLVPHHRQLQIVRDIQSGRLRTSEEVKHAGIAMRDAEQQIDAFGMLPTPSKRDLQTLSRLEEKISLVADMVAAGFKDGECIAAQRVDPDRVRNMAEKITLMRKHLLDMEHQLRRVSIQNEFALQPTRGIREGTQH